MPTHDHSVAQQSVGFSLVAGALSGSANIASGYDRAAIQPLTSPNAAWPVTYTACAGSHLTWSKYGCKRPEAHTLDLCTVRGAYCVKKG